MLFFIGPKLPLDIHFSVGNFIKSALLDEPIYLHNQAPVYRSYMYTYDLSIWLAQLLANGKEFSAYNVGSDRYISIQNLAELVIKCLNSNSNIEYSCEAQKGQNLKSSASNFYIPNINKSRVELGLDLWTNLEESVKSTALEASRITQ